MTIRSGATHGIQINTGSASLQQSNSSTGGFRIDLQTLTNAPIYSYLADADTGIGRAAADTLTFYAGGEKARIFSTGNLLVQNGGTFTDSGQRLQVTGDTLLKGSGNTSATTALTVQDSGGTALFRVRNDGTSISRGGIFYGSGLNNTITTSNDTNSLDVGGLNFSILFGSFDTAGYGVAIYGFNATRRTATSGLSGTLNVSHGYAPTSGTGTYRMLNLEGTINQTGGANGITRGLYVNPILTAAADWRSIEWSNNSGWGLYGAGTSNNYLGGSLGIGSTALTGISLRVGKNITGGTTGVGISSSGVIKNDVTTNAILVVSSAFSDTSGFNTTNVYHYLANRGGYSSTATNAYGYFVDSTVNYATNNYAFYGNIAAATNSWNLYMNGTADNYLGGRLSIGTTSQSQGLRIGRNPTTNDSRTIFVNVAIQNTVTSKYVGFSSSIGLNASGFTLPDLVHFEAINDGTHTASVVTNLYGFRENLGTYSATNVYGHYGNIPSGTNRWNLYMNGTANNYMAGRLGLGTTSLTNVTFRNNLQISGSGTSYLNVYEGTIQNGVTVGAYYNFTSPVTLASSFTTTDVYSYGAGNATIGAGSAITNLYGFHVAALTAATNNYGFYGNIAAATNRWNFYANGTAANYFNGNTLIGSTTDSGEKLQVTGTAKITGASSFGGNMTLSLNQNAATNITVSNTTSGTTSEASLSATSSNGTVAVSKYSATRTTYRILAANDGFLYNGTSGDLVIFNDFSTGNIKFGAGGTSTEQMRLTSAGNLCIGVSSGGDFLNIAASTTAKAQINLASGTAPTSPNNGDIWFTGTELKIQVGGVTKTFTLV
jgi:hypothetical protein